MPNKNFISISQAASILKVSPDTLRNWEKQGKLIPERTVGGARRYKLSVLQLLVKEIAPVKKRYGMLSVSNAARELGVSNDTLRSWDKKGLIEADRTEGGARRFAKAEVLKLKSQMSTSPNKSSDNNAALQSIVVSPSQVILNSDNSALNPTLTSNESSNKLPWLSLGSTVIIFLLLIGFFGVLYTNQTNQIDNNSPKNISNQNGVESSVIDSINDKVYALATSLEQLQNQAQNYQVTQQTKVIAYEFPKSLEKGTKYVDLIGKTIIDSFGNIYPASETQKLSTETIMLPKIGSFDRKYFGLYLNNFDVNGNGDMFVHGNSTLGDSGTQLKIGSSIGSDIVPTDTDSLKLGTSSKYFNEGFIKTISGSTASYGQINSPNITLAASGVLDLASSTAGASFAIKIPSLSSGSCSAGVAEGLIFKDSLGNQLGHACIDSGVPKLRFYAESFNASATDLAENYSDEENALEPGDIVQIDENIAKGVKKADFGSQTLLGIVSDKPGLRLSGIREDGQTDLKNPKAIALAGRVYTKVSDENGSIAKGDYLTASSQPGVAMKSTHPGMVVGQALEDSSCQLSALRLRPVPDGTGLRSGSKTISSQPANEKSLTADSVAGSPREAGLVSDSCITKILTFVNLSFADPTNLLANLAIDQDGSIILPETKSPTITLNNDLKTLTPVSDNSLDSSNLTQVGLLAASDQESVMKNFLDIASNLETIKTSLASSSAILASHEERIEELGQKINSNVLALSKLEEELAQNATESGLQKDLSVANQNNISSQDITSLEEILASNLTEIEKTNISNNITTLSVSDIFKSLGETFLGPTSLAGDLTVDGTFSISQNSINVIGLANEQSSNLENNGILYLQNSPLAQGIDIFNGLVVIDKTGGIKAQSVTVAEFKVYAHKTSGSGKILKGDQSVLIDNLLVSENSRILVTPTSQTDLSLGVTEKSAGKGFKVSVPRSLEEDLIFDWFLIQEVE